MRYKILYNADKTKVMVFGNGRLPQNLSFSYDNLNLEIVKNFNRHSKTMKKEKGTGFPLV
jgi:hypothetical protein